jgi:hypothetical protein
MEGMVVPGGIAYDPGTGDHLAAGTAGKALSFSAFMSLS